MPALHDNIIEIVRVMGGERALSKMDELQAELLKWHNREGSTVAEEHKGCWDGGLAAWKRAGMPKKGSRGYEATEEGKIIMIMFLEQYNFGFVQDIVGTAQAAGRRVFSKSDYEAFEALTWHFWDIDRELQKIVEERVEEAAELI
jgi:hypothetical protein